MPYCPQCGYEYIPGAKFCPDCQSPLAEGEQLFCNSCNEPITGGVTFCPHCGVLLALADKAPRRIMCDVHKYTPAVGACVVCGKPVCEMCAVKKLGKLFCDNDEHVKMAFDWVALCSTSTQDEAAMIKANLEGAGIEALVFSQSDRMFFTTVGDLAVNEVMVPKRSLDEAQQFLRSINVPLSGETRKS
jgi:hypothetical protein